MVDQPLPGEQWIPSNSTAVDHLAAMHCRHCARGRAVRVGKELDDCELDQLCDVLARGIFGDAVEWRRLSSGHIICTAFTDTGQPIPQRCPATADMWEGRGDG